MDSLLTQNVLCGNKLSLKRIRNSFWFFGRKRFCNKRLVCTQMEKHLENNFLSAMFFRSRHSSSIGLWQDFIKGSHREVKVVHRSFDLPIAFFAPDWLHLDVQLNSCDNPPLNHLRITKNCENISPLHVTRNFAVMVTNESMDVDWITKYFLEVFNKASYCFIITFYIFLWLIRLTSRAHGLFEIILRFLSTL